MWEYFWNFPELSWNVNNIMQRNLSVFCQFDNPVPVFVIIDLKSDVLKQQDSVSEFHSFSCLLFRTSCFFVFFGINGALGRRCVSPVDRDGRLTVHKWSRVFLGWNVSLSLSRSGLIPALNTSSCPKGIISERVGGRRGKDNTHTHTQNSCLVFRSSC